MRHLTVGVFQDETLGRELGKKGTLSDIAMYNRKSDEHIFTFMSPVEDKLTAKSQIISTIDAAIVVFSGMTRELGETVHMLDMMGVKEGIVVNTPYSTPHQIAAITQTTSIKSFRHEERDPRKLLEALRAIDPPRQTSAPAMVVVDHSFTVKGVGEVVLGFVKGGVVKKFDKLALLPAGREVIVRSIQVQDEDLESAEAGTRVGLATRGATLDELGRGAVLTASGQVKALANLNLTFMKSPFYADELREGTFHATLGMQTNLVKITNPLQQPVSITSSKSFACETMDQVLLLDLNAKKSRILGKGTVSA
jgi:selenocysteine-specific translation elongation factor